MHVRKVYTHSLDFMCALIAVVCCNESFCKPSHVNGVLKGFYSRMAFRKHLICGYQNGSLCQCEEEFGY